MLIEALPLTDGNMMSRSDKLLNGSHAPSSALSSASVAIGTMISPSSVCRASPRLQITRNSVGTSAGSIFRSNVVFVPEGVLVSSAYSSAASCRVAICSYDITSPSMPLQISANAAATGVSANCTPLTLTRMVSVLSAVWVSPVSNSS